MKEEDLWEKFISSVPKKDKKKELIERNPIGMLVAADLRTQKRRENVLYSTPLYN